jgi:hypothetical protein
MARCIVTYSTEVAGAAHRAYFWARIRTPLGVAYIASFFVTVGLFWFFFAEEPVIWIVGAIGLTFPIYLVLQGWYFVQSPKAFAKRLVDPTKRSAEIETSAEGVRILFDGNARLLKWETYKHIWLYSDFVILSISPALMGFVFIPTNGMTAEVRRDLEAASKGKPIA